MNLTNELISVQLRQLFSKLPPSLLQFPVHTPLSPPGYALRVGVASVSRVSQLLVNRRTPSITHREASLVAGHKMFGHDVIAFLASLVLEKVSKLSTVQVECVAYVSIEWRLKTPAMDVFTREHHLSRRNKVCVFMNNVMNGGPALPFFRSHVGESITDRNKAPAKRMAFKKGQTTFSSRTAPAISRLCLPDIPRSARNIPHHGDFHRPLCRYLQIKEFARSSTGEPNRPDASILDTAA
jgi:hypothetical protein